MTFDPGRVDVEPGGTAQFDVFVSMETVESFNFVDVLPGSNDLQILSFDYAQSWIDANVFPLIPPFSTGIFPSDLFLRRVPQRRGVGLRAYGHADGWHRRARRW